MNKTPCPYCKKEVYKCIVKGRVGYLDIKRATQWTLREPHTCKVEEE